MYVGYDLAYSSPVLNTLFRYRRPAVGSYFRGVADGDLENLHTGITGVCFQNINWHHGRELVCDMMMEGKERHTGESIHAIHQLEFDILCILL